MKKPIAAILVFFFFTTNVVGATPSAAIPIPPRFLKTVEKGSFIDISPEIGIVENVIPGSDPLIIHIQDAHAVAEAQVQINRILRELTVKHHIQFIGLEGAAGKLVPGKFKFTSIEEVNSAVNNSMLREGRLTGAELFAVENQAAAVEFAGLEDKDLYKEDLRIFKSTLEKWVAEKDTLDPLQNGLAVLKKKIFSPPLQRFDEARSDFEERKKSLFAYVRYLDEAALKYLKLDLSDSRKQRTFSNVIRIIRLSRLESRIEKKRGEIEKEKNALIDTLARSAGERIGEIENEFLLGMLREIGKGQWPTEIPPRYFFESLYAAAKKQGLELKADQAFAEFAEFLILRSEMDAKKLFREIAVLESRIYEYLIRTKEEKELVSISRDWNLLEKFLGLEVSREEYESASARERELLPSALFARIKKIGERNKIQTSAHDVQAKRGDYKDAVSDELAGEARKFYDIARRRESSMVENLLGKVKEKNLKAAVLITGGFHSKGIDEILAHKGVAHITISPRIREEVNSEQYHHVILGGKTWLEQALHEAALPETGVLPQNSVLEQSIAAEEKGQNRKIVAALISADDYLNPLDPSQPEKAALDAFVRDGIPALLDWAAKQPGLGGNPAQWVRAANGYLGDFGNTALGPTRMALAEAQDSFSLSVVPAPASGMTSFNTHYALRTPFSVVGKPASFSPETAVAAMAQAASLGVTVDESRSFSDHDAELKLEEESAQRDLTEKLPDFHAALRHSIESGEVKFMGQESEETISRIEGLASTWTRDGTEYVIFAGPEGNTLAPLFLQGLTHRDDWNESLVARNHPQIHFLNSNDSAGVRRLLERIPQSAKVRLVYLGDAVHFSEDQGIKNLGQHLNNLSVENPQSGLFNEYTTGLLSAGLLDGSNVREIHKGVQTSFEAWKKISTPGDIKAYQAYRLAAAQIRMAQTGQNVSIFLIFSTTLRFFTVWLALLYNKAVGNSKLPVWFSGEYATDYFHSTQQGWAQARGFEHNEAIRERERRGFISLVFFNPEQADDVIVEGLASRLYQGFGFRFLNKIAREALRLSLKLARRLITDVNAQVKTPTDLGRFIQFGEISAAMAGKLAEAVPAPAESAKLDEAVTHASAAQPAVLADGALARNQNILNFKGEPGQVAAEGVIGDLINQEAARGNTEVLTRVLQVMKRLVGSGGLAKVVKDYQGGTKLAHLNPDEITRDISRTEAMARRFQAKGYKRVYAVAIGGSVTGEVLTESLALADGPKIIGVHSYDADMMRTIQEDIRRNPQEVAVVIISKSGVTAETDANGATLYETLTRELTEAGASDDEAKEHFLFITDPQLGKLRQMVESEGLLSLDHSILIGGRFSMFSNVGLFYYFLKGGKVEALQAGLQQWAEWHKALAKAVKEIKKFESALDPKKDVPLEDRLNALREVQKILSAVPGVWEGVLDNLINTVSAEQARDTEVALGFTKGFEPLLASPLYAQIRAESKSKPGVRFYGVAVWGWAKIRNIWSRLMNNKKVYVTLLGEGVSPGKPVTDADRASQAAWNGLTAELNRKGVPFMSVQVGAMSPGSLLNVMWLQYLRLAVDTILYEPMEVSSEGQGGVEQTKSVFRAVLFRIHEIIEGMVASMRTGLQPGVRATPQIEQTIREDAARLKRDGISIPEVPAHEIETMTDKEMDLADSVGINPEAAQFITDLLLGDHGLMTTAMRDRLEFMEKNEVPLYLRNLLRGRFRTSPDVGTIYLDGRREKLGQGQWIVRATSLERPFNLLTGTANGTSFGIYKRAAGGELEFQASVRIVWGSSVRAIVSNGKIAQDFQLLDDGRVIEVSKSQEDNSMLLAVAGDYLAPGGVSSDRPQGFLRFEREVLTPTVNTKIRISDAPTPDAYKIMTEQGLITGWMTWGEAYELASTMKAASGLAMVMTDKGLQHIENISEQQLNSTEQIYVYAGNPEPVRQIQVYLDFLSVEEDGRPVVLKMLETLAVFPEDVPNTVRAQAVMWALRLREGIDALPSVEGLKGTIQENVRLVKDAVNAALEHLDEKKAMAALREEYLGLSPETRESRAGEFTLLGDPEALMRSKVAAGEETRLIYALEKAYHQATPWDLMSHLQSGLIQSGKRELAETLASGETVLQQSYRANAKTQPAPEEPKFPEIRFAEDLGTYLDQSVKLRPETGLETPDGALPDEARAVSDKILDVYLRDQQVLDLETNKILQELKMDEPELFYESDGQTYIHSLRWIQRNLRERKTGANVNQSGDVSSRLDHIFNKVLIYFTSPLVEIIISEEEPDPVQGQAKDGKLRIVLMLDPIDGSSQIAAGGTYGLITTIGFLKPGQTIADFNPRTQVLSGFDLMFGPRTRLTFYNPANPESNPERAYFELTKDGRNLVFRRERGHGRLSLRDIEDKLSWDGGLLPQVDEAKALRIAMGGSFVDSTAPHSTITRALMDRYSYLLDYTGALLNDIGKLTLGGMLNPQLTTGVLHTYGPTNKHPEGRFRLAFEEYFYSLLLDSIGGEVIDGKDPILDRRLTGEQPSNLTAPFYAGSRWITKLIMAWNYYLEEEHVEATPEEFEKFLRRYQQESARVIREAVAFSNSGLTIQPKTEQEVRRAILDSDGDISDILQSSGQLAYQALFASAASLGTGREAAASGQILPANIRREFPDARHLTMNANFAAHQYRFNGKTYSPAGLLVPKSTAVEEIGDEELVALILDPRPGFITIIVEDDNAMTYATMYLIMRLMALAQREFTFGLATGGTTESLRKGLGLANLAKSLFGQYLDWGKVRGMNTLDDYLWRDPEVLAKLGKDGFWWPAPHSWDRDRFDDAAYALKFELGAYRNEQKYMLLRNALPHWTDEQIDRAFVSPPVLYGSAIEAEERFIRNMSRFTTEAERSLFTLSGLGTGRHDGFAESALDAIALTGEIVTDLRKILDIPDTLTRVDYPGELLQADGLQRHSETTQIQNFGHFGGDMKFHKGFLRLMGKLRINFIDDLINWLSMKRFEEIQDSLEKDYQFASEQEFLTELQKVLNYYSAERNPSGIGTPPWSMTQKTGDVIERAFNPDTVKIVMVGDQPHKQESAADSYTGQPNPPFTPSALYLAPRTVLVATQMGARKMDKAGAWFFTSDNPNAVLLTGEGIEEDWRQTAEGQRIAGPAGVKAAWSKKLAEASSLGTVEEAIAWADENLGGSLWRKEALVKGFFDSEAALAAGPLFVPRALVENEARMGLTPVGIGFLRRMGVRNPIYVEAGSGINRYIEGPEGRYFNDDDYRMAGENVFVLGHDEFVAAAKDADEKVVVSIKEPQDSELEILKNALLFTYVHLAEPHAKELTSALRDITQAVVAYETVMFQKKSMWKTPILAPASEGAGWVTSVRYANYVKHIKGKAVTNGRVFVPAEVDAQTQKNVQSFPGMPAGLKDSLSDKRQMVLGGGVAGVRAAITAAKMGAHVYITEVNQDRIAEIRDQLIQESVQDKVEILKRPDPRAEKELPREIIDIMKTCHAVVGAILVPGATAPVEVTPEIYQELLEAGNLEFVGDIAIDQGGNIAGSVARKYKDGWVVDETGVAWFTVTNMPSALPKQISLGLERAKLVYLMALLMGPEKAVEIFPELEPGFNILNGKITYKDVADKHGETYVPFREALSASMGEIPAVRAWKGLVNIFPDRPAMGDAAAADITALMRKLFTEQDRLVLNLASAPSQMDVWHSLVKLMSADPDYWREKFKKDPATGRAKIKMIHFDEFTGRDRNGTPIDENHEVSFRWLLRQNFFNPLTEALGITFEDLEWYPIKGEAEDIQAEARRYEREVLTNPATGEAEIIDISIGGYGENGHWAFNDPPDADFNDPKLVKVVDVTKSAQNVAQQIRAYSKYFQTKADISPAITETMAVALKRVRYHFLLVPGPAKANAIYQAHTVKNPTTEVPASVFAFSKHELEAAGISDVRMEGVKVYIDEKAAIGTFRELMEGLDISRQPDKNFVAELAKQVDSQSGRIANAPGFHPAVHEKLAALKQAIRETAPAEDLLSRLKDLSDTQLSLDVAHLDEFTGDPWAVYEISKNSGLVKWADDHLEINPIQGSSLGKGIQRILLVDDEAVSRLMLSESIKNWNRGIEVVEKSDGIQGLAEYRRAKSEGRPFDLVITDMNMPRMNGDELVREINPSGVNAVPVMMLTGLIVGNEPLITPLLESGQIRLALEKPSDIFDASDIFAFLDRVNRELLAKAEGSSLGEKAEVSLRLEAEGRNLSAVTGTIEQFSGGMVGNERNPAVLEYLLSIYADSAVNQAITQSDVTEGEFAVLLTTPKYLSPESVKAQLKVNPRALVVVVAEGSADKVKQYTQAMRREFPAGFGQNLLIIPADRGQTGQVFKDLLFGKNRNLWDRASSLYPELVLNYSNLAQYTSLFASANDLRLVSASLATKLAAPRKAELNRGNVAYGEFNLYANTLAFLIARKGGFAKLSKEIPDVNQGIVPMNGINEFGFNISDLKETIAGLVSKFQEMLALGRAA